MKKQFLILVTFITFFAGNIFSQNENVIPVQVKEKFSDITLTSSNGELVNIPTEGRNTMLVFIRGKVTPTVWCPICQYQYMEMIKAIEKTNFTEKYDMDIYFVMPYKKDSLQNWIDAFPQSLSTIDRWKNPENQTQAALDWRDYCKIFFAGNYTVDPNNFELKLPVMFDPDQKVSNGLVIYRQEWGGTKVPQNVPTVYILDKEGKVKFKYFSQYTNDRPDADYLIDFIEKNL
jgi:peroxiredoxin